MKKLVFNVRHLEKKPLLMAGELGVEPLELEGVDEMIQAKEPLRYEFQVELLNQNALVTGRLSLNLDCQCVRCLKSFQFPVELGDWICHIPLVGEEAVRVENDCVDLTPFIREDILLAFPQHPLCELDCSGLHKSQVGDRGKETAEGSSAWAELNKLKL